MSGFKKLVVTTLIIASVAIGIGSFLVFESGMDEREAASGLWNFFKEKELSLELGSFEEVKEDQVFSLGQKEDVEVVTPYGTVEVQSHEEEGIRLIIEGKVPSRHVDRYLKISDTKDALKISLFQGISNVNFGFTKKDELIIRVLLPKAYDEDLKVVNVSGDVLLQDLMLAEVTLENVSGDLIIESGRYEEVDFRNVSGQMITYGQVEEFQGENVSGKVTATNLQGRFQVETVSGAMHLRSLALQKKSQAESVSGKITVELEGMSELSYDLSSVSGKIQVESGEETMESGRSLKRNHSDGEKLVVSTVSGSILVKY